MPRSTTLLIFIISFITLNAYAEPTSSPVSIASLRPYTGTDTAAVYVYLKEKALCDRTVYRLDLTRMGAKEVYAAALAAMMGNKQVRIEIDAPGCEAAGHYKTIRSIYIHDT